MINAHTAFITYSCDACEGVKLPDFVSAAQHWWEHQRPKSTKNAETQYEESSSDTEEDVGAKAVYVAVGRQVDNVSVIEVSDDEMESRRDDETTIELKQCRICDDKAPFMHFGLRTCDRCVKNGKDLRRSLLVC